MSEPARRAPVSYRVIRQSFTAHHLRVHEVPVEHAVSLPVPTRRWTLSGYAAFAGPARRVPGESLQLGLPDRWWLIDARSGDLLAYNRTECLPFAAGLGTGWVTLPTPHRSIAALQEDQRVLDNLMEAAAPDFFAGGTGAPDTRADLAAALAACAGAPVLPWYRALAPDFFRWLEG